MGHIAFGLYCEIREMATLKRLQKPVLSPAPGLWYKPSIQKGDLMAETATTTTPTPAVAPSKGARKKLRREGRKKLITKLRTNLEFAKTYFEAKSKRSTEKKSALRKKKSKKK